MEAKKWEHERQSMPWCREVRATEMGLLHSGANRSLGTLAIAVSVKWW